jgi:membrane protein insertase Oxa1/YidC/SpoIIIJ
LIQHHLFISYFIEPIEGRFPLHRSPSVGEDIQLLSYRRNIFPKGRTQLVVTMKFQALALSLLPAATAFAPVRTPLKQHVSHLSAIDPSSLHDMSSHLDSVNHFISSLMLSDGELDASAVINAPAADVAADPGNGWFGFLTMPIEGLLKGIHVLLTSMGMSADAWGVSIIAMTIVIKLVTFPLTKQQLESTNKMQVSC